MEAFTPEQEQYITEIVTRLMRRYGEVVERLGTDLHALVMVLVDKRLISVAELDAARKQLDRAYEVTQARQLLSLVEDIDRIGDRLARGEDDAA